MRHGANRVLHDFLVFNEKDPLKLHFLNRIYNKSSIGNDRFIQSDIEGPDKMDIKKRFLLSPFLFHFLRENKKINPSLYLIKTTIILSKSSKKKTYFGTNIYIPPMSLKDHEFIKVTKKGEICTAVLPSLCSTVI